MLCQDRELVLAAVTQNGRALQFAWPIFQEDFVVVAAVRNDGNALEFALPALKANPTIAMTAIRSNVRAMRFVSSELRDNRAVILLASDLDGTFERASPKLCTERTFVLAVLKRRRQFPFADMKFISPQLRADRDVASAMVKCAMNAMQSVSLDLRADRSFVVQAIRHACGEVPPVRGHRRRPARHLPPHEPWRGMGAAREGRARTPKRGAN